MLTIFPEPVVDTDGDWVVATIGRFADGADLVMMMHVTGRPRYYPMRGRDRLPLEPYRAAFAAARHGAAFRAATDKAVAALRAAHRDRLRGF